MLSKSNELEQIFQLKTDWILSEEEFEKEKVKILNSDYNEDYQILLTYNDNVWVWFFNLLFSSKGRVNRITYIILLLLWTILWLNVLFIMSIYQYNFFSTSLFWIFLIIYIYSSFILGIKRLHDINLSWYYILSSFIPIINTAFWIWLILKKGTVGDNKFWNEFLLNKEDLKLYLIFIILLFLLLFYINHFWKIPLTIYFIPIILWISYMTYLKK